MVNKNICPTHHFRYTGTRCPICESERIKGMVKRFVPKEESIIERENKVEETLDWNDLASKFKISTL